MKMVRSSRSESRYSLPFCGLVMRVSAPGFAPDLPTASLSPFTVVLMTRIPLQLYLFGYRTAVRYSTVGANDTRRMCCKQGADFQSAAVAHGSAHTTEAEICSATARRLGRKRSRISLRVVRVEWVLRLSAATVWPSPATIGT